MSNVWAAWLSRNGTDRFQLARKAGWDAFVNAAQREPLQLLSRADMAGLSGEELEDYTQARMVWNANLPTVRTTQLDLAYGIIEQVMASGPPRRGPVAGVGGDRRRAGAG